MSAADRPEVGVVGGGPWGVALALAARRAGSEVTLHTRRALNDERVRTTSDYAEVARARLLVIAVPSAVARTALRALGDHLDGSHLLVHAIRGLGADRLETISDIAREETPVRRLGALGGPAQANELVDGRPSAIICGSRFPEVIAAVTTALSHRGLRIQGTSDLRGIEWASALAACLALGAGFASEAGAGPGLLAALITRGVEEAARIAVAAGAQERTMFGLGGYGDLLAATALTDRPEVVLGRALARGRSIAEAMAEAKLRVEAVELLPRVVRFAKEARVQAAIFDAIDEVLKGAKADEVVERMLAG